MARIKIVNQEPAGGELLTIMTYDLKPDGEGKVKEHIAGTFNVEPGEEHELLVSKERVIRMHSTSGAQSESPQNSVGDSPDKKGKSRMFGAKKVK